ncbi:MAG: hypothetical protein QOK16_1023 [Solirubrobacteraceae bacterium]|nr:hypothetical protein [Solirubrobacteraceae bacterium]MEA2186012.1 hypothetical protein [Solirubrobacteraceae bacterium]
MRADNDSDVIRVKLSMNTTWMPSNRPSTQNGTATPEPVVTIARGLTRLR